jgi:hypothetical protein
MIELNDVAKQQPVDGDSYVWNATRRLWVPQRITNIPILVADATARAALTGLTDGQLVFQADVELLFQWDADAGGSWRGVRSAGLGTGATGLSDQATNPSGTWIDWLTGGSTVDIPNPGVPVTVVAILTGYLANFTTIDVMLCRVSISFDGGSSYTTGKDCRIVAGQGGSNYNSQACVAQHVVSGTPSGTIKLRPAVHGVGSTAGSGTNGVVSWTMCPV